MSRKRKKKNWEDDDYYDSDDDTFLDRTGTVERKRQERMKKAGKIEERPETYESLVNVCQQLENIKVFRLKSMTLNLPTLGQGCSINCFVTIQTHICDFILNGSVMYDHGDPLHQSKCSLCLPMLYQQMPGLHEPM